MDFRTAKSSSVIRSGNVPRFHRRSKLGFRLIFFFLVHTFGDTMYLIGARIERNARNFRRALRVSTRAFFRAFGAALGRFFGFLADRICAGAADIAAPFCKLGRSIKSLFIVIRSSRDRGFAYTVQRVRMFFKYGFLWNKSMVGRLLNYLLPAACLAACVFTITTVSNLNFALKVSYNGNTVGYVEDESVYNSACRIIQNQMVSGTGADKTWSGGAELSITVVDQNNLASQDDIAAGLLSVSGEEIAQATGLYIGGTFYGATTAGQMLSDTLDGLLATQRAAAASIEGDVTVKFARDVKLVDGVYPASSISSYEDLVGRVTSDTPADIYYTAVGGESSADVATENGISLDRLTALNGGAVDSILPEGTKLLVATGEKLLRVKTVTQVTRTETIAFETIVTRDSRYPVGYMSTISAGESGERTILSEIEYVDGQEVSETVISEEVTKQPVDQEIIIGVKQGDGTVVEKGSGILTWPTGSGSYMYVSRGFSSYHFGIDIAAPIGTPLYAADSGVVTVSEYTTVGYGYYIIIDHQNGMQTVYGHCSQLLVNVGETVTKGQVIALMGSTGNSTGSHLHFETRVNGVKVDPAYYLYGDTTATATEKTAAAQTGTATEG